MRRRTLLSGLAATLPLGLAGCAGNGTDGETTADGDDGGGNGTPTPTAAESTPTAVESPTMETTAAATTTATDAEPTDGGDGDDGSDGGDGGDGGTDAVTATPTPTPTPTATPAQVAQVVDVGADGFNFAPERFEVAVGDTVRWVWGSGGHNVRPDETPGGSDWSGTPGGDSKTYDRGYEYEYTFEVAGEYTYYCDPHRSVGMTGSFTVTE